MAFKELTSLDADTVISIGGFNKKERKDNPTNIEGYYLGSRQVPSPKSKSGFSFIHVFQTSKGNVGVWGKKNMDDQMSQVTPGTMTQVSFKGTKPTKNGNDMYMFRVAVDADNTIEVAAPATAMSNANSPIKYEEPAYNDNDTDNDGDGDDEDALQAAELQALERQAKLNALLKKNKPKTA